MVCAFTYARLVRCRCLLHIRSHVSRIWNEDWYRMRRS